LAGDPSPPWSWIASELKRVLILLRRIYAIAAAVAASRVARKRRLQN
jgi:hypothetical protein